MAIAFGLLLQLQDVGAQYIEPRFRGIAEQWISMRRQGRSDFGPIGGLQCLQSRREKISIFHHDVTPLVIQEIANDGVDVLARNLTSRENSVDRGCNPAQSLSPFLMFACKLADLGSCKGIAKLQLQKDPIFLGMVVQFSVDFEVRNNGADDLVVRLVCAIENIKLVFEDREQPFNIAVLPV